MKKSIIFTGIVLIIICVATLVQAVAIGTTTPTITLGQNAIINVTTTTPVYGMEFTITYDDTMFDYVSNSTGGVAVINTTTPGTVVVSYTSVTAVDTISFTFKSTAVGTGTFGITAATFFDQSAAPIGTETVTTASTKVTVTAPAGNNTTNNTTTPGQIPNAGFDYIPIIIAVVLIVGVAVFLKMRRK